MYLTTSEICNIYANRDRNKPEKTIKALADLNCCTINEIHCFLDTHCETYRNDDIVSKPKEVLKKSRKNLIENRKNFPILNKGGLTFVWKCYFDMCKENNIKFEVIEPELVSISRFEIKKLKQEYNKEVEECHKQN